MATLALPRPKAAFALPHPAFVAVALLFALVMPNPSGYVGAGGDDYHYVQAARCFAANGWCVPDTHWASRWPLVAPMGAVFALLGDGVIQSMVVPLLYSLTAVLLFAHVVETMWGRSAAMIAGIAFVATASFAKGLLQPNAETVELVWLLGAVAAGTAAARHADWRFTLLSGLCFGLAVQTRMTSLAWLPILVCVLPLLSREHRRLIPIALVGLTLPLAIDALVSAATVGRPFLAFELSATHTRIGTTELPAGIDVTRSPLFNPQFIGGWAPAMGIDAHWSVQGAINLLANPQMGPVLLAVPVLMWFARVRLTWRSWETALTLAAAAYAAALIYALAVDPKARMFLPAAAIAAALVGRLSVTLWRDGERAIPLAVLAVLLLFGAIETAQRYDMTRAGPLAGQWAREHEGELAVDDQTRRTLTFDATMRTLPVWPAAERPRLVSLVTDACRTALPGPGWTLARTADFGRPNDPLNLCEFVRSSRPSM